MALERKDRIKDQTTTTGTGIVNLDATAPTGFRTFVSSVTSGATVRYLIENSTSSEWEVGEGVFTDATPDTLSRVTVYASSNSGSLVNFSAGTKNVSLVFSENDLTTIIEERTHQATSKATPVDADELPIVDSAASNVLKKLTWANLKATLLTYFNTVFPGKDGWMPVADSWSYASASTITVPSGAATLYKKGDKIKWTQTTVKYGVIITVADTLLTIAVNDEYTVANAAISSIYISHEENPIGWPAYFTFSTVHGGYSSAPTGKLKYNIQGNRFICDYADATGGTSNATTTTFTVPIAPASSVSMLGKISYKDNGANSATTGHLQCTSGSATISAWTTFYQGAWTNANGKDLYFSNLQFFF
jgi:hypothetical protein